MVSLKNPERHLKALPKKSKGVGCQEVCGGYFNEQNMTDRKRVKAVPSGTSDSDVERERSWIGLDTIGRLCALFKAQRTDVRVSV